MMLTFRSLNELDATEGTVKLVDASHQFKSVKDSDIVLIPQPTDDPNDPLNWPRWKKNSSFIIMSIFCFSAAWVVGGIASGIVLLMKEFHKDLNDTVNGVVNWAVLLLGLGVFFWVPATLYFGTRPVLLLSSLLLFVSLIWSAATSDFNNLVASRVLAGFALSAGESLPAIVVRDIFFLHERGFWMGVYILFFQCLPSLFIIVSGFLITAFGWRWHFWFTSICFGANLILCFLFFPETQYRRDTTLNPSENAPSFAEKGAISNETTAEDAHESATTLPSKKSFLRELNPWSGINPGIEKNTSFFFLCIRPWPLVVYPAVIYSFLAFSFCVAFTLMINNTAASIFQKPPYNMTPGVQSLIHLPPLVFSCIGTYLCGGLTDIYIQWRVRKNNGIYEPEMRLVFLLLPLIIVPIGLLMYGFGVAHKLHWAVPFLGSGLVWFGSGTVPTITIAYVVDSYFAVAPENLLLIIGLKNVVGFGFSYAVIPWLNASGYVHTFGTMAGLFAAILLLGVPLWYWGKTIRHATSNWKIIMW